MTNSIFNLIYCILTLLRLMNVCIFTTTIFCSSIYQYKSIQYFRIIFVYFIGNIAKLCCNISYISFSLSRFSLSSNTNNKLLLKLESTNLKRYYTIIILSCSLFRLFKCFQYQTNEIYNTAKSFPLELYDIENCRDNNVKCKLFKTWLYVVFLLEFCIKTVLIIFLFDIFIDILINGI